jgi:small conductance mechanosensitive channel
MRPGARVGRYQTQAQGRLRRFRQGSLLAVAVTAWLLMMLGAPDVEAGTGTPTGDVAAQAAPPAGQAQPEPTLPQDTAVDLGRSAEEAARTARDILVGLAGLLPALLVALGILAAAALLTAIVRPLLRRALRSWTRADAMAALAGIVIWLVAISAALSVIVGDPRTLLGSVGLIGLALSWALQQPIESFTAWLLNSFRSYYRVGDRIGVGDVFGDVYRIDFLTTTVWEAGGPEKPVQGAQPTGALVTFPNSEVLRANVVNYTRDFPFVWDEVDVPLTNESDLDYSLQVLERTAAEVVGQSMAEPIHAYRGMIERASLEFDIADAPQVFFSQADSWTNATIRYLVDARRRRITASRLIMAISRELSKDEHRGRMDAAYPTARLSIVSPEAARGS